MHPNSPTSCPVYTHPPMTCPSLLALSPPALTSVLSEPLPAQVVVNDVLEDAYANLKAELLHLYPHLGAVKS